MSQEHAFIHLSENGKLDLAASAVSDVLDAKRKPHAFIGGYAVTLVGGDRTTKVSSAIYYPYIVLGYQTKHRFNRMSTSSLGNVQTVSGNFYLSLILGFSCLRQINCSTGLYVVPSWLIYPANKSKEGRCNRTRETRISGTSTGWRGCSTEASRREYDTVY